MLRQTAERLAFDLVPAGGGGLSNVFLPDRGRNNIPKCYTGTRVRTFARSARNNCVPKHDIYIHTYIHTYIHIHTYTRTLSVMQRGISIYQDTNSFLTPSLHLCSALKICLFVVNALKHLHMQLPT